VRIVLLPPDEGGVVCPPLVEQLPCGTGPCPVDCEVSGWGVMQCSKPCGGGVSAHIRTVTVDAVGGGTACPPLTKSVACNTAACLPCGNGASAAGAADCAVADWTAWSPCTSGCGGLGVRVRSRRVVHPPHCAGAPCPALLHISHCNTQPCVIPCQVSAWGNWGACSVSCGPDGAPGRMQRRARAVLRAWPVRLGGAPCPALRHARACGHVPCPLPCVVGAWAAWGNCTAACGAGNGLRTHARQVLQRPRHGGRPCPPLQQQEPCNTQPCPVDCELSDWSGWSDCTRTCGSSGSATRTRVTVVSASGGGQACRGLGRSGVAVETVECNRQRLCPEDCRVSSWSAWGLCSAMCGGGARMRTRLVHAGASAGGVACPHQTETDGCNRHACTEACPVGRRLQHGLHGGGHHEGGHHEGEEGEGEEVEDDLGGYSPALVTAWSGFDACSWRTGDDGYSPSGCVAAFGGGTHMRTRRIVRPALRPHCAGGRLAGEALLLAETAPCNVRLCAAPCAVAAWGEWGLCSAACGGGSSARHRTILSAPSSGGAPCPDVVERRPCGTLPCAAALPGRNCTVAQWGEWGACSAGCGGGDQLRVRAVTASRDGNGGQGCGATEDARPCNTPPCAADCAVSGWGAWSACGTSCGPGVQTRVRSVTAALRHGGRACPELTQTRACDRPPTLCPVECLSEWRVWGDCSASCGGGSQVRVLVVNRTREQVEARCASQQTRGCNTLACQSRAPTPAPAAAPTTTAAAAAATAVSGGSSLGGGAAGSASSYVPARPILTLRGPDHLLLQASLGGGSDGNASSGHGGDDGLYEDAGASCSDSVDGPFVPGVHVAGGDFPDRSRPGTYALVFGCVNAAGRASLPLTRTVHVVDRTCPVCLLRPGPSAVEASFPYTDPGVECSDDMHGTVAVVEDSSVNVERVGVYVVTYRARDGAGNWNDGAGCWQGPRRYVRTVTVVDTFKPVLQLKYGGVVQHQGHPPPTAMGGAGAASRTGHSLTDELFGGTSASSAVTDSLFGGESGAADAGAGTDTDTDVHVETHEGGVGDAEVAVHSATVAAAPAHGVEHGHDLQRLLRSTRRLLPLQLPLETGSATGSPGEAVPSQKTTAAAAAAVAPTLALAAVAFALLALAEQARTYC
jgi:hypothetical protein